MNFASEKKRLTATCLMFWPPSLVWSHILLNSLSSVFQEGASLRHILSSNDLNNNDNEFDGREADQIVNLSASYSESSMSGTYQQQAKTKQVGGMSKHWPERQTKTSFSLSLSTLFTQRMCMYKHNYLQTNSANFFTLNETRERKFCRVSLFSFIFVRKCQHLKK